MQATAIKERPILMCGDMVRAVLKHIDPKTVTRRIIKPQPSSSDVSLYGGKIHCGVFYHPEIDVPIGGYGFESEDFQWKCPYGQPGDRLWVKETWSPDHRDTYPHYPIVYRADGYPEDWLVKDSKGQPRKHDQLGDFKWRPSIFMPRHLSRIDLEVVSIRVEQLHEITDMDLANEGFLTHNKQGHSPRDQFSLLWDQLNGRGTWAANPWVWRVEFKRVKE